MKNIHFQFLIVYAIFITTNGNDDQVIQKSESKDISKEKIDSEENLPELFDHKEVNTKLNRFFTLLGKNTEKVMLRRQGHKSKKEKKLEREKARSVKERHDKKVEEIIDFIKDKYVAIHYLHSEMERIIKSGVIRDKLRTIVKYLESAGQEILRKEVLKCFLELKKHHKPPVDVWKNRVPNNLILLTANNTNGIKMPGPDTTTTLLLWKIWASSNQIDDMLPDETPKKIKHTLLKDILANERERIQKNDSDKNDDKFVNYDNDNVTKDDYKVNHDNYEVDYGGFKDDQSRLFLRKSQTQETQIRYMNLIKDLKEFMDRNYYATDYFYEEVKRIKKSGKVKNSLRNMVDYLSLPGMKVAQDGVFKCFNEKRKKGSVDIWKNRVPNNLIINI